MEHVEPKTVRDARGEARRMSRKGGGSYQQCLDAVARDRGHDHWAAFARSEPRVVTEDPGPNASSGEEHHDFRNAFKPAIPYQEWRRDIQTMTRDPWDERRVDRVARLADRIAERTGLPLRFIGCAPILLATLLHCVWTLIGARNGADAFYSVFFTLPAFGFCFVCNVFGNSRMLGGMRSSMEDLLGLAKLIVLGYVLIHLSILMGDDPKVTAFTSRFYDSFTHTLIRSGVLLLLLQAMGMMLRWMFVVATRYPPAMREPTTRTAKPA